MPSEFWNICKTSAFSRANAHRGVERYGQSNELPADEAEGAPGPQDRAFIPEDPKTVNAPTTQAFRLYYCAQTRKCRWPSWKSPAARGPTKKLAVRAMAVGETLGLVKVSSIVATGGSPVARTLIASNPIAKDADVNGEPPVTTKSSKLAGRTRKFCGCPFAYCPEGAATT